MLGVLSLLEIHFAPFRELDGHLVCLVVHLAVSSRADKSQQCVFRNRVVLGARQVLGLNLEDHGSDCIKFRETHLAPTRIIVNVKLRTLQHAALHLLHEPAPLLGRR